MASYCSFDALVAALVPQTPRVTSKGSRTGVAKLGPVFVWQTLGPWYDDLSSGSEFVHVQPSSLSSAKREHFHLPTPSVEQCPGKPLVKATYQLKRE